MCCAVELAIIGALVVAAGAGLLLLVWILSVVLLGVFLKYFALF